MDIVSSWHSFRICIFGRPTFRFASGRKSETGDDGKWNVSTCLTVVASVRGQLAKKLSAPISCPDKVSGIIWSKARSHDQWSKPLVTNSGGLTPSGARNFANRGHMAMREQTT